MSNPQPSTPSARPKPRPTTGTARGRAQVPGALTADPSGEIAGFEATGEHRVAAGPALADVADQHTPGHRLPVSELLFHRAGAASPFGDDLRFPLPAGALTYPHP